MEAALKLVQTKPHRLEPIANAVLVALIMAGIFASWLVILQRFHPAPGSASSPLLVYDGHVAGPAVWSLDSNYISLLTEASPAGETVVVWNKASGQVTKQRLRALGVTSQENYTVFAPDGKHLAFIERITNNQEGVQVWDIMAWRRIFTTYYTSPSGYLGVLWSPDSTHLVIPGEDGTMQVWDVVTGHELVACHVPVVDSLPISSYLSPDGQHVLYGYGPQYMYVLDLSTCKLVTLASTDANATVWSPQGNRFATISLMDAHVVQVWDAHTGRNLASFHLAVPMSEILWTPDGTRIVASGGKEVDVLEVATQGIVLKVIPTSTDLVPVWALSPDGKRIASLSGVDRVQIWDAATGHKLNAYQRPGNTVKVVVWSPNSTTIATGSIDGTVRVWNAGRAPETYHSDASGVLNFVWSPDGKSLAAETFDGHIWVWKVNKSSI